MSLLKPEFHNHRYRLLAGLFALLIVDMLQLVIPRIMKHGVDALSLGTASSPYLLKLGTAIIAIALCVVILRVCWRNLIIGFSRYLERALRNRIFNHILLMDQAFFEKRTTGDIMAHGSNDLTAVQMACGMGLVAAADAFVLSIAAVGFMIHIHPTLTLLALLPMPLLALSTKFLSGKLHNRFNTVQEQFSLLTEFARSALISVKLSKAYTFEKLQSDIFNRIGKKYVKANIQVALVQGLLFPAATLIGNLGLLAILVYGGRLVINETISMGDFVAFITYLQMLIWPIMAVGWVANLIQRGLTALRRIYSLVKAEPLLKDQKTKHLNYDDSVPVFRLNKLNFSYPSSQQPELRDISFTATPGIIGIAGPTGGGKTTLCRLLLRLYPVENNVLFFCNRDVNQLSLDDIRSQIGYVSQEPVLFSESIKNNISYGKPDATQKEIEQAARDAGIHTEIQSFPHRYETNVGERGMTLSGGQRQRLALARALVCERPVLIIDDGLSAVDTATESAIVNTLKKRLSGKTVFIVSNRIKLLAMTDRILLIENGMLTADAGHDELLKKNDFYRSIYSKQNRQEEVSNA